MVVFITAPNSSSLANYVMAKTHNTASFYQFGTRQPNGLLQSQRQPNCYEKAYEKFGVRITLPTDLNKYKEADNFCGYRTAALMQIKISSFMPIPTLTKSNLPKKNCYPDATLC